MINPLRIVQTLIRGHQSGRKDEGASVGILIGGPSIGLGLSLLMLQTLKSLDMIWGNQIPLLGNSLDSRGRLSKGCRNQSGIIWLVGHHFYRQDNTTSALGENPNYQESCCNCAVQGALASSSSSGLLLLVVVLLYSVILKIDLIDILVCMVMAVVWEKGGREILRCKCYWSQMRRSIDWRK